MSNNALFDRTIDPRWLLTAPSVVDDSTIQDQYVNRLDTSAGTIFATHIPTTSLVTFQLNDSDDYVDLHRAYLKVQVGLVNGNGGAITADDVAALSNNIVGSMISQARLSIWNKDVENVNHVDVASTIALLSQLSCEEYKSLKDMLFFYSGEEGNDRSLVYDDQNNTHLNCTNKWITTTTANPGNSPAVMNANYNGNFTARYNRTRVVGGVSPTVTINFPLKYIFNFTKDLNKLLYKSQVNIHLTLTNDWNKCVDVAFDDAGLGFRPYIKYMSLRTPSMVPSVTVNAALYESYLAEEYVHTLYTRGQLDKYTAHTNGTNRIEWRIGNFSGDVHGIYFVLKRKDHENVPGIVHNVYDNAGVRSFQVRLGNKYYPKESMTIDFGTVSGIIDYADAYNEYLKGTKKLANRRDEQALITYAKYPSVYPVYYLDLSKHEKSDTTSSEEITLVIDLDGAVAYNVYALVEQEHMILMQLSRDQKITIMNA